MKSFLKICLFLSIFTMTNLLADEDSTNVTNEADDDYINWSEIIEFNKLRQPRIDLVYGFANPIYHKDAFKGGLSPVNVIGIELGYEKNSQYNNSETVYKYKHENFFLSNIKEYSSKREAGDFSKVRTEAWRFGFNSCSGFGYELGSGMKLALAASNGIGWTKLEFLDSAMTTGDQESLNYVGDAFRFGTQTEAVINVKFTENIGINAGFERAIVFPRHMFWYWAGSEVLRGVSTGLLSTFVKEIGKSSPSSVPIVNFILQNALNYGFYELRQKNMNWPIETEPPFMFDTFKVGVNVNF